MDISIFTVGSVTTAETEELDSKIMREYFRGMFRPMALLADDLEEFGCVNSHILSHEYGYVKGDDLISEVEGPRGDVESMQASLRQASRNSDVIVIAFMKKENEMVVKPVWEDVVDNIKSSQIWGLSAPKTAQEWLISEDLKATGCEVIVYDKVGPALVSKEFKQKILSLVESR